ncbi:hypothetical protein KSF73_16995 [Burkholderiaceae bacterium DAT-1]|nr:hypothetical protein [Burkholderiaceae bacterium DAT-1]
MAFKRHRLKQWILASCCVHGILVIWLHAPTQQIDAPSLPRWFDVELHPPSKVDMPTNTSAASRATAAYPSRQSARIIPQRALEQPRNQPSVAPTGVDQPNSETSNQSQPAAAPAAGSFSVTGNLDAIGARIAQDGMKRKIERKHPWEDDPQTPQRAQLAREINKATRADCRNAYAGAGLLAVVPLAIDAVREGGCKW